MLTIDLRLLDATAQEQYYTKIVERYMTFCSDAGQRDELLRRFSSLDIGEESALSSARRRPDSPSSLEVLQGAAGTKALAENAVRFYRLRNDVDGHRARIMDWAEADMRTHALKCIGKTYMSIDLELLERMTGSTLDDLRTTNDVGWELDGRRVIIRKPR
ncbi:hypothetical protein DCS_07902 [Drechmeria coniospora]|uniref:CSN8/PSMD8/EIF3K domain-containing protein n=1 Tax=Drechmeria coniospora TaxID=98403 RepID=A0A151GFQ6_DRECN|nr:hypothetical protein DCS_07902 [Drechmeria coniospora]KYK55937.1 hypothetical protein DCS_07902 [Drechmeria coniospora]